MGSDELIQQLKNEGIHDAQVLKALAKVPRELFVPSNVRPFAHEDIPLPIGYGQTISQPYVVARMTELLLANGKIKKVLEIGTGSGYQAAILAQIVDEVYTIERIKSLFELAKQPLQQLGYQNIFTLHGDGYLGWPEHAPYDGIIITAASPEIPQKLREQLADGGRMVIPVGEQFSTQQVCVIIRHQDQFEVQYHDLVVFVPMLHGKSDA